MVTNDRKNAFMAQPEDTVKYLNRHWAETIAKPAVPAWCQLKKLKQELNWLLQPPALGYG